CVHYNAEPARREQYHRFVGDGMRDGFAADDGVALHFRRKRLRAVVSSRTDASAYRVEPRPDGVCETRLVAAHIAPAPPRSLPPDPPAKVATGPKRARRRQRGSVLVAA